MQYEFTPAAQRVLAHAANWSVGDDSEQLQAVALLLGLLEELECRAGQILMRHEIGPDAVRDRWPQLQRRQDCPPPKLGQPFSSAIDGAIQAIWRGLAGCPQPETLATEHLLLGIITAGEEAAGWLQGHGLCIAELEAEIDRVYGRQARGKSQIADWEEDRSADAGATHDPSDDKCDDIASDVRVPDVAGPTGTGQIGLLRVLDAAANRAREGLRVVEDYVRFVWDDRHLTTQFKQMRHDLAAALGRIPAEHRLAARETQADVGTTLATPSEQSRSDPASVLTANFLRLQEALRSLEEFGKLLDVEMAADLEQLRYRAYTLHRAVEITRSSIERLRHGPRLYVLIDGRSSPEEFERLARAVVSAGVHVVQLREKRLDDRRLLERARLLRKLTHGTGTLFVVNDRPDLAVFARADGVHVGQEEVSVKDARTIVGPDALIGVSTHSIEQARQAVLDGANYIGVGPVFPSGTKQFERFAGVELLRAVAAEIRLPAFAIGGITRDNMAQVMTAGFRRIAVREAIISASEPSAAAREILEQLDRNMADRRMV